MHFAYLVSVFFHLVFATFWIGGMLFLPLIMLPAIKGHPDRVALLYKTGMAFRLFGWVALTGLLLTGLLNVYLRGLPFSWHFFTQSDYGHLLTLKLVLFLATLAAGGVHDFYFGKKALQTLQTSDNRQLRQLARWSGRINLLLALAMAFIGVMLSRGAVLGL